MWRLVTQSDSKEARMQYVGIDWGNKWASWCSQTERGEFVEEGRVIADIDGLAQLVVRLGPDVEACIESMSGALWVRERLAAAGWQVSVADARKVKAVAPLAAKTDKVDARLLSELSRRDLVPAVWVPPLADRALKEQLRRRAHLVWLRTSAKNRVYGILSQWGVRISPRELPQLDYEQVLEERGMPPEWRRSVAEAIAVIDSLDQRIGPYERELKRVARADQRARLLATIPGVGELLGLTIATEIGDVTRFRSARKLVGYSGLTPRIHQSGQSSRTGSLTRSGSKTLRWAAVEAAQHAYRETNPWHQLYLDIKQKTGKANPAKAAVARKILIAAWHVLSRNEPFKPPPQRQPKTAPASSSLSLAH
jgi:transposase